MLGLEGFSVSLTVKRLEHQSAVTVGVLDQALRLAWDRVLTLTLVSVNVKVC